MKIIENHDMASFVTVSTSVSSGRSTGILQFLVASATLLLLGQLLVGTSPDFAIAVYLSLVVVSVTLCLIGFATVAGILISYMAFRYLVFSQIVKTVYGQPGDSHLQAPETTILLLFIGFTMICAAALLISKVIGNRKIVFVRTSDKTLAFVRNASICLGIFSYVVLRSASVTDNGEIAHGGVVAIARQLGMFIYVAILAETWRVLQLSEGRRSVSAVLISMVCALIALGFLLNSKGAMASPVLMYFFACAAYRGYLTRKQICAGAVLLLGGVIFAYPAVQLVRKDRAESGLVSLDFAAKYAYNLITDPASLFNEWQNYLQSPDESLYTESLEYLGTVDDLRGRFMLIANTDVIANAVNDDGPYGLGLIGDAFRSITPTVLDPNKPRVDSGDLLTWYYGLRGWDVVGYPTIGIFADSYAAMGWPGIFIIPSVLMLAFFLLVQIAGARVGGNFLAIYLAFYFLHTFGEMPISGFLASILRDIPIEVGLLVGLFYLADVITMRREHQTKARARAAGINQ